MENLLDMDHIGKNFISIFERMSFNFSGVNSASISILLIFHELL